VAYVGPGNGLHRECVYCKLHCGEEDSDQTYGMCHITRNQETVAQNLTVVRWNELLDASHLFHERRQEVTLGTLVGYRTDFFLENEEQLAWRTTV
jgi:hypothetical protein